MSGLDDQAEVRRESTTVARTCGLLVRIRSREIVGELPWTLEHLAIVIRSVGVLDLFGHGTRFISSMRHPDQVAPGNTIERMASSTDLAVYLVTSTNARMTSLKCRSGQYLVRTYLVWSKVSNKPWCGQGYAGGWRPSSAIELAWTSPMKGREPYRWVYHAIDPAEKSDTETRDARDVSRDWVKSQQMKLTGCPGIPRRYQRTQSWSKQIGPVSCREN